MQINVTGKNIEVTPAIKSYLTDKLTALDKRFSSLTLTHVVLHVENHDQIAEATLHFAGNDFHATATSPDMYQSIDLLEAKLISQLTKHKEKIIDERR